MKTDKDRKAIAFVGSHFSRNAALIVFATGVVSPLTGGRLTFHLPILSGVVAFFMLISAVHWRKIEKEEIDSDDQS